jgi:hypothetical protein
VRMADGVGVRAEHDVCLMGLLTEDAGLRERPDVGELRRPAVVGERAGWLGAVVIFLDVAEYLLPRRSAVGEEDGLRGR